ncbi:hypothetical protein ACLB2K_069773 [Fragaria x ananassa]
MVSLPGMLQRPLIAAAAVGFVSFSSDFYFMLPSHKPNNFSTRTSDLSISSSLSVSDISASKLASLSFVSRIRVPIPNINFPIPSPHCSSGPKLLYSFASSPTLLKLYHSADLSKAPNPTAYNHDVLSSASVPDVSNRWHLPEPNALDVSGTADCSSAKMRSYGGFAGMVRSKAKASYELCRVPGGKVEEHIDSLVTHLADWLEEEQGKNLVFHTFSNTGWLSYGIMLEKFQKHDPSVMGRIRGCVVDSAPVAAPDPHVWASGFSAAFLKKHSVATKGTAGASDQSGMDVLVPKPGATEAALLLVLEKIFEVVLNLPIVVKMRLSDVSGLLSARQPSYPQSYIYSSADSHSCRTCGVVHKRAAQGWT